MEAQKLPKDIKINKFIIFTRKNYSRQGNCDYNILTNNLF